ncbi:uncharacterized protein LOC111247285 [Varroa destructor]|uniref:Uncharacterized protein n=1 Tax=Varroa destructor TaxID=109461 RepID=A0A7M7JLZ6_VARDE|nr:uncharacterized protein LOC111247285 [Varroa destructor]
MGPKIGGTEGMLRHSKNYEEDYEKPVGRFCFFTCLLLGICFISLMAYLVMIRKLRTHVHLDYQHMQVTSSKCIFLLAQRHEQLGKYAFRTTDYTVVPKEPSVFWTNMGDISIRSKILLTDAGQGKGNRAFIISGNDASIIVVIDQHWNRSPSPSFVDDIHKEIGGEQSTRILTTTGNTTFITKFWLRQELFLDGDEVRLRAIVEKADGVRINHPNEWKSNAIIIGPITDKIKWRLSLIGLKDADHKLFAKFASCKYKAQTMF